MGGHHVTLAGGAEEVRVACLPCSGGYTLFVSVILTSNNELPIPAEVCARLGLHPGEEFEVLAEQNRLVAIRKGATPVGDFRQLMSRLGYVRAGRRFSRDEANER
jgi:hypothetical protein